MKITLSRVLRARPLGALAALMIMALAAAISSFGPVAALQVDQTRNMNQRAYANDQPIYYRLTINYNDSNIGTAQAFGALQKNTFVKAIDCHVTTAFNAGTANSISIGTTTTSTNEIFSAGGNSTTSIAAGSTGVQHLTTANGLGLAATSAADTTLYAKYLQAGTAATAGAVTCVIEFVPNNDL